MAVLRTIAILGAGAVGHAMAGDLALRGYEVRLWGRNPRRLAAVIHDKQVRLRGLIDGDAQLAWAGTNIAEAIKGADILLVPLPAFAQRDVAELCAHHVEDGQIIVTSSHSGMGSVQFAKTFREMGVRKEVRFAEVSGSLYGARFMDAGMVDVANSPETWMYPYFGAFPALSARKVLEAVRQIFPRYTAVENSLAVALVSHGPMTHPAMSLLYCGLIERFDYWDLTGEVFAPSSVKVLKALDDERKAITAAWGFSVKEAYNKEFLEGGAPAPHLYGVKQRLQWAWKDRLHMEHRYVSEDLAFGMVLRASAAERVKVPTPTHDAIIHLFSVINGKDYRREGRTLDSLGFGNMSVPEILQILRKGWQLSPHRELATR